MNANSFQNNTDAIARQGDNRLIALHPHAVLRRDFAQQEKKRSGQWTGIPRGNSNGGETVGTVYSK